MVKLIFYGSKKSETTDVELTAFCNFSNEIFIEIDMFNGNPCYICLDKDTAIKFSKELRKQIAYIQDEQL
jgi:hypothetical protein